MSEDGIQALNKMEAIRERPAMYIGNTKIAGFHNLVLNLLEDLLRFCLKDPVFEFTWYPENRFTLAVKKLYAPDFANSLEEQMVKKFNFSFNIIAALNSQLTVTARHDTASMIFSSRQLQYEIKEGPSLPEGQDLLIDFAPDAEIFIDLQTKFEWICQLLQEFTFLNPGLKIISVDHAGIESQRIIFHYPGGLVDKAKLLLLRQDIYGYCRRLEIKEQVDGFSYQVVICSTGWDSNGYMQTYAGNTETWFGGSLTEGILEGIIRSVRKRAKKKRIPTRINRKLIRQQFIILAYVKGTSLEFEGALKRKLSMPGIQKAARKMVAKEMERYMKADERNEEFFIKIEEK